METRRLDELCVQITDCPHSTPQWLSSGKLVLRNFNIHNGRIDLSNVSYTDDETFFARNKRATPIPGDIVMSREAPMGEVAIIPNGFECCLGQRMVLLHPDATVCNGKFLMYSLLSPFVQKQIKRSDTTGSVVSNLCIPDLCALEIPYVNIERQEYIVALLSDIDAKIDNNNAIAAELEGMAKDLYDYWFVQFDFPDEHGKPYKSSGGKMVWNDELKREIPEGWEATGMGSICSVLSGYPFESKSYNSAGKFSIMTIKNIQDGYIEPNTDSKICKIPSDIQKEYVLHSGNILMSLTGNVGRVGILCKDDCLLNQRAAVVLPAIIEQRGFVYFLCRSKTIFEKIQHIATGTSQKNVSPSDIHKILIPYNNDVASMFSRKVDCLIQGIINCNRLNQDLASLRDFLLPMLMNGQVKVKGA